MGSKSRSSQSTQNQQSTTNIVNDGEFAGASHVTVDESETRFELDSSTRVDDSYNTDNSSELEIDESFNTDNSVSTETRIDQDIDNSQRFEYEYEYEDSFNTDNSTNIDNRGEFSGNHGSIQVLDGNAIDRAFDATEFAIDEVGDIGRAAFGFGENVLDSNENVSRYAIDEVGDIGRQAVDEVGEISRALSILAIDEVGDIGRDAFSGLESIADSAIDTVADNAEDLARLSIEGGNENVALSLNSNRELIGLFVDELGDQNNQFLTGLTTLNEQTLKTNAQVLKNAASANTQDKQVIAELAKNTALGGQDIVAQSSVEMVKYVAGAAVVTVVIYVLMGRKK